MARECGSPTRFLRACPRWQPRLRYSARLLGPLAASSLTRILSFVRSSERKHERAFLHSQVHREQMRSLPVSGGAHTDEERAHQLVSTNPATTPLFPISRHRRLVSWARLLGPFFIS